LARTRFRKSLTWYPASQRDVREGVVHVSADSYITFLFCGALLVVIDGQILYRSGLRFLGKVYQPDGARSVMNLVAVLFHLIVLGVLALISTINVSTGLPLRDLVVKLGIVLLTLGLAHALTMRRLVTFRERRRDEQLVEDEIATERAIVVARDSGANSVGDRRIGRAS